LQKKGALAQQNNIHNSTPQRPSPHAKQQVGNLQTRTRFQRASTPHPTSGVKVIQRNINSTRFEKSDEFAALYMVNPKDRRTLYSRIHALPPKPTGLYAKTRDRDDATGAQVFAWTPNVRFLTANQMQRLDPGHSGEESPLFKFLMQRIEKPAKAEEVPTFGILGKNDCTGFAEAIYRAIASEQYGGEAGDDPETRTQHTQNYPGITVGDLMMHKFDAGVCNWHGATVVAADGDRQVTLEADVSKPLAAPEFRIRRGVAGFVQSNISESQGETSRTVDVMKYGGGMPQTGDIKRYTWAKYQTVTSVFQNVGSSRKRPFRTSEINSLRNLLFDPAWGSEGTGFLFSSKTPEGISVMRRAFNRGDYWEVFRIATEKTKTTDLFRSKSVQLLYEDLASRWERVLGDPSQSLF
jgi:hypothetical protein